MPFIMVAYFLITSIFASSFAGILVLIGLSITSIIVSIVSQLQVFKSNTLPTVLTFENWNISNLPLSTSTFAYVLGYFIQVIIKNDIVSGNTLLLVALSAILVGDLMYQLAHQQQFAIVSAIIGILLGIGWGAMLPKSMQMIPQSYDQSKCNVKKGIYRCKIKRTGEVLH